MQYARLSKRRRHQKRIAPLERALPRLKPNRNMRSDPRSGVRCITPRRKAVWNIKHIVAMARNASIKYALRRYEDSIDVALDIAATGGYVHSARVDTARRQPSAKRLPTRADPADDIP